MIADESAAKQAVIDPRIKDAHFYYEEGDCIKHGVGAKPYVLRCYAMTDNRSDLDGLTERLFNEVEILDSDGNDLLYSNQVMSY